MTTYCSRVARRKRDDKRSDERSLLHFVEVIEACVARRAIAERTLKANLKIRFTPDGAPEVDADHGDAEDLRSLMMDFRKLLAAESDAEFLGICNIIERRVIDPELIEANRVNRTAWKKALRGDISFMYNDRHLAAVDFLNVWMNGVLFHSDPTEAQLHRDIGVIPVSGALFQQVVNSTIIDCLRVALAERNVALEAFNRRNLVRP